MPKRSIRAQFLAERKTRSKAFCLDSSRQIQQRLLSEEVFARAEVLALYSEIHNEVSTGFVAEKALALGKILAFPRVAGDDLEFIEVESLDDLSVGAFDVLEPKGRETVDLSALDMVVVPGVVFDKRGHRLGYGKGFYDRTLSRCSKDCVKVGLAYDFQLIEALPSAEHDEELSLLITEERILNFHV